MHLILVFYAILCILNYMTKRRDIIKALKKAGFKSKGGTNHETWVHPDGRRTVVGRHTEIPTPTARLIVKQAKIDIPK